MSKQRIATGQACLRLGGLDPHRFTVPVHLHVIDNPTEVEPPQCSGMHYISSVKPNTECTDQMIDAFLADIINVLEQAVSAEGSPCVPAGIKRGMVDTEAALPFTGIARSWDRDRYYELGFNPILHKVGYGMFLWGQRVCSVFHSSLGSRTFIQPLCYTPADPSERVSTEKLMECAWNTGILVAIADDLQEASEAPQLSETGPEPNLSIDEIAALIEEELPGWAWTISKITNDRHSLPPYGSGFSVTVSGGEWKVVYEKAKSLHGAALRAIGRAKQILADLENEIMSTLPTEPPPVRVISTASPFSRLKDPS